MPRHPERRSAFALYGAVLIALTSMLIVNRGTPLYDGVGFPDQPYRYVHPPSGYRQQYKPTEARTTLRVVKGTNADDGLISSGESGPQVAMYIQPGGLQVLDAATAVTVRARPVSASAPPVDGSLNSNVYDVDFGPHPVRIDQGDSGAPNVTLREAVFQNVLAVMEYRPAGGGAWRRLQTGQVGRDVFLGALQGPGQYVLIQPATGTAHSARNDGSRLQLLLILGFCLLVVAAALVAVRRTSPRDSESNDSPDGSA
jgi:hypothetical protein